MRKRSESFYAKTEEEFDSIVYDRREKSERRSRVSNLLEDEDDDLGFESNKEKGGISKEKKFNFYNDMDDLGVDKSFQIKQLPPTEQEDEYNLMDNIEKMNNSYKAKDKSQFIDEITKIYKYILKEKQFKEIKISNKESKRSSEEIKGHKKFSRSLTFDNLENISLDFDLIKNIEEIAFSAETTCNSFNSVLCDPILSKNINVIDDVLKLVIIGDQNTGKSFFIKKLLEERNDKKEDMTSYYNYYHTSSFEIKKKNINLLNKHVCLELWDTNTQIVGSEVIQVYYKMCDGFFLIFDPLKPESIHFIDKQIQSIIKFSLNPNFFIIANLRFLNNDFDKLKEFQKKFADTDKLIKDLVKKYDLKIYYINIDSLKLFKNQIKKFLSLTFIKKGMNNIKFNQISKKKHYHSLLNPKKPKNNRNSINYVLYEKETEEETILGKK